MNCGAKGGFCTSPFLCKTRQKCLSAGPLHIEPVRVSVSTTVPVEQVEPPIVELSKQQRLDSHRGVITIAGRRYWRGQPLLHPLEVERYLRYGR